MSFKNEAEFEKALIAVLEQHGWDDAGGVLYYPTEEDLLNNWAQILFENNKDIDRLNACPLTEGEMAQILEQIEIERTPQRLNEFINGGYIDIKRDNIDDALHFGKEVSLKIYNKQEIASGQSRYQIAVQPKFKRATQVEHDRRGDVLLLINGMPVIHIELKASGVPVSYACNQIKNYVKSGVLQGIYSLIQVFVAMTPEETKYFANPGMNGNFNESFYFHWADFNNEPINDWKELTSSLLSIPMAHQLIGFYTVADSSDGVLKVLRSYQYYAAAAISNKVRQAKWEEGGLQGGYIWHTTGSGKTMTSFKAAQLIASSGDADKVVFLMDRVELGTQSVGAYRDMASDDETIQETENTDILRKKLNSTNPKDALIVTSIQKMYRVREDNILLSDELDAVRDKRVVFIIDECHRSTFGKMLIGIKQTFPNALFFGFTGTPIHDENQKKLSTTATLFGDELHRYSIADGIRDKNVLGFDPYKVLTFKDSEVRETIALREANASSVEEALSDPKKSSTYYYYMDKSKVKFHTYEDKNGKTVKGLEEYIPKSQYRTPQHQETVVKDILDNWVTLSQNSKFHALFATSSIIEAIEYYRILKKRNAPFKFTALFDPNFEKDDNLDFKEDGLTEIMEDYNKNFDEHFTKADHPRFKRDIAARLAHKRPYVGIEDEPNKQLDLLIVVDQMLTGFDSKWLNTLYLDKLLEYEHIIQAFSRTNRVFGKGQGKQFGIIRYYRYPHTMEQNIKKAVKLYSGDKEFGLFVPKLRENIGFMKAAYENICRVFVAAGLKDFTRAPEDEAYQRKFIFEFNNLNKYLEAAEIQGLRWNKIYTEKELLEFRKHFVFEPLNKNTHLILVQRAKELVEPREGGDPGEPPKAPLDLDGYITEIDTSVIDQNYMEENFNKWLKALFDDAVSKPIVDNLRAQLHSSFATLTKDEQRFAEMILLDIESGELEIETDKSLVDYIQEYQEDEKTRQINEIIAATGVDEQELKKLMNLDLNSKNINEYDRLGKLKATVDIKKAKEYFEKTEGKKLTIFQVNLKVDTLLREFLLSNGVDI